VGVVEELLFPILKKLNMKKKNWNDPSASSFQCGFKLSLGRGDIPWNYGVVACVVIVGTQKPKTA
jgi:hypothetical protein